VNPAAWVNAAIHKERDMTAFLARLREPSTYAGVSVLLGLFGVQLAPELMQGAIQAITGAAAVAAVILGERSK
jgi:hypothetical protein